MEDSIVRENLMTRLGYTPYCGSNTCNVRNPRTTWSVLNKQFYCSCGWVSNFPKEFIDRYVKKWNV